MSSDQKADFSNVKGGGSSTAADAPPLADFSNVKGGGSSTAPAAPSSGTTHTVVRGDTLSAIAKQAYGKASLWPRIYDANRDQLDNPDRIKPGQILKIPAADA